MLMATEGSFYKIENRLFVFCGIFKRGEGFFLFSVVEGLTPGSPWPWISPAPGAIQQQPGTPDGLDSAGRYKIQEMQVVHTMQTHFDRVGTNDKANATK